MDIKIIFEDKYFIVIDKPRGVVVNRAESVKDETIQEWVEKKYTSDDSSVVERSEEAFYQRAGIVHRLDKETSGLLLIAKDPQTFEKLQRQFKERTIKKKYIALVHGKVIPARGEIVATVGRLPWNRERFGVLAGGREAATSYKLLKFLSLPTGEIFSLLEVTPLSGRTHQIRIHLKYIGHTIVGDNFYAGRKTYRRDIKFCPYLFLHAAYLSLPHPATGQNIEFKSDLPAELLTVLSFMTLTKI